MQFPPWFDAEVRHALRVKEAAHHLKKAAPLLGNCAAFAHAWSDFKTSANAKYRSYLTSLVADFRDNPKRFWSFIKNLKSS